jgi:PST family polysaccharide transporter
MKIKNLLKNIVFNNIKWLAVAQFGGSLIPFILIPFLKEKFESEYFNSIFLLDSIGVFYFILCEYGINVTSSRDIAANKKDLDSVKKIINKSFSTKFILNIFFFSVFFIIIPNTTLLFNLNIPNPIIIFTIVIFKSMIDSFVPNWYFNGMEDLKFFVIFNLKLRFCSMFLNLFLLSQNLLSLELYFSVNLASSIIILIYSINRIYQSNLFLKPNLSNNYLKENISYFGIRFFSSLYMSFVPILVSYVVSINVSTFYSSIDKVIRLVNKFISPISDGFYPRLSSLKGTNDISFYKYKKYAFFSLFGLGIIFSIGLILFFPLIDRFFLANYIGDDKIYSFFLYALLPILLSVSTYVTHLILNLSRKGFLLFISILLGSLTFVLSMLFLAQEYGLLGVCLSVLFAECSIIISSYILSKKKLN